MPNQKMHIYSCPSCSGSQLLRHARSNQVFWVCLSCRQEVIPLELTLHNNEIVKAAPEE
jgi:ribosomal protein L37AE/L43A